MRFTKPLIALAGAIVVLAALATVASANRLSFSSRTFRATWISAELSGGFGTPRCSLTLEGSLHSGTITKTQGSLIGFITRASIGPCINGSATVLTATLPWHVQYGGFGGTLPSITSITTRILGLSMQIRETGGITCLRRSEATHPATGTYEFSFNGSVTGITLGGSMPTSCGFEGTLRGTSTTNSAQTVTLI